MSEARYNFDGRHFGENGEPDYFLVQNFWAKLLYLVAATVITALGVWTLWDPAARFLFGERAEGRVVEVVRMVPGEPEEVIRVRREVNPENHTVRFGHFVEVIGEDGTPHRMRVAVDSQREPYAQVNDRIDVIYFEGEDFAFGLYHFRTWAFGVALTSIGGVFMAVAIFLLSYVGKKIYIDPENQEDLEKEREALEREGKLPPADPAT